MIRRTGHTKTSIGAEQPFLDGALPGESKTLVPAVISNEPLT